MDSKLLLKNGLDKKGNLISARCCIKELNTVNFKMPEMTILFGECKLGPLEGSLNIALQLFNDEPGIRISSINAGQKKGLGRGSFALNFFEHTVIKHLNLQLLKINIKPIRYIFGYCGPLLQGTDINTLKKFYLKNGYVINDNNFRKQLW